MVLREQEKEKDGWVTGQVQDQRQAVNEVTGRAEALNYIELIGELTTLPDDKAFSQECLILNDKLTRLIQSIKEMTLPLGDAESMAKGALATISDIYRKRVGEELPACNGLRVSWVTNPSSYTYSTVGMDELIKLLRAKIDGEDLTPPLKVVYASFIAMVLDTKVIKPERVYSKVAPAAEK